MITAQAKGKDGQTKTWNVFPGGGCTGLRTSPCPPSVSNVSVTYDPAVMPEGSNTLTITAKDSVGHASPPQFATVTVDNTPPDTVIDTGPANNSPIAGTTTTFTYHSTEQNSRFECKLDSGPFASCSAGGFTTPTLSDGSHTFSVRAKDQVDNLDGSPETRTFLVGAPDTVIDSGPLDGSEIIGNTVTFTYHSTKPISSFECKLDSGTFASCPSNGFTTPALADGSHTFSVRAKSPTLVQDPSPATRTFLVGAPDTLIDSGPTAPTTTSPVTFTYHSTKPNSTFQCKLDSAAFASCSGSGFTTPTLVPGDHTFSVRAISSSGLVDPSPATRFFIFDPGPQTTIDSGPNGPTQDPLPRFTYSSNDPAARFECRLVTLSFKSCPAEGFEPEAPLGDGFYMFEVRAVDLAGNPDLSPATSFFSIDTEGPFIEIESGPEGLTGDPTPTFTFFAPDEPRVDCAITPPEVEPIFEPCNGRRPRGTEPTEHRVEEPLPDGPYTFRVRATDNGENEAVAERSFVVKTNAPETTIEAGPAGAVPKTSVTFEYSADLPSSFQCRLDAASFAACPNAGSTLSGLSQGEHTFEVRAISGSSIVDVTPAQRRFIVDTSPPSLPAVSGAVREPGVPGLSLRLEVKDGDPSSPATIRSGVGAIRIRVDGQVAETLRAPCSLNVCPATAVRRFQLPASLVIGTHRYVIEAEDGVGHFSPLTSWEKTTPVAGTLYAARASGPTNCLARAEPLDSDPVEGVLKGTNGSDLIRGGRGIKVIRGEDGCDVILGGPAQEVIQGGKGNDLIRAKRSNDEIFGDEGADQLYGGIGDDTLHGGPGSDLLDGGPGADVEMGKAGNDTLRGGQGEDQLAGGDGGVDTLSYADLIPPGFEGAQEPNFVGFPGSEAGVVIDLSAPKPIAVDFLGAAGDALFIQVLTTKKQKPSEAEIKEAGSFERIVGSAFNDLIKGTGGTETILGGPGSDVILGGGGGDPIEGGSGDNYLEGQPSREMQQPSSTAIRLGESEGDQGLERNLFLVGGNGNDAVKVKYFEVGNKVQFIAGSTDIAKNFVVSGCRPRPPDRIIVNCPLGEANLGAVALYGAIGDDTITIEDELPERPGAFVLGGGPDSDTLQGGVLEELLDDGRGGTTGVEHLRGGGGDDVLFQGDGADEAQGGGGNDLLISSRICQGDKLFGDVPKEGDTYSDNAQFHPVQDTGVFADLEDDKVGEAGAGAGKCGGKDPQALAQFNDLEGSPQPDVFLGTDTHNLLIGRGGADTLLARGGRDVINAKDLAIDEKINCGGQPDDEVRFDADVGGKSEAAAGIISDCKIRTPKGTAFPSTVRAALLGDQESEPPGFGSVAESLGSPAPPITNYFSLDDTEDATAENSVEGAANGTYEAVGIGPSVNGPGPILGAPTALLSEGGSAATLNGTADYVDLAGQGGPGEADGYSVVLFVKFARQPGQREYLFSSAEDGKGAFLYREPDGRVVFAGGLEAGAPKVASPEAINDDKWHQVVGSMEGETITLNLDGFSYRLGYGQSVLPELKSPQSLIGAGPGRTDFLAGTVDELVTYEGALSHSEVFAQIAESQAEEPEFLPTPAQETSDVDGDGVTDGVDNCPELSNPGQGDLDLDGIGDACVPPDSDGDGVSDLSDNCPTTYNPEQTDDNGDGIGNECAFLPPIATTEVATDVKGTSATLTATVNPRGTAATYQFEYGTTTDYGEFAPLSPKSIGSGPAVVAVAEGVGDLQAGTTYHYRVVATNEAGEAEGVDRTFTTPSDAPPVGPGQIAGLATTEPFDGSSASVARFTADWSALGWASGDTPKGEAATSGWRPVSAFPTVHGAFYETGLTDTGTGVAAVATMATNPSIPERHFSLWLDMPSPASPTRAGYELRFTDVSANTYDVTLSRWQGGTQSVLASRANVAFPDGSSLAVVDQGEVVSAWTNTGSGFTQLMGANDAAFTGGNAGLEGAGNITRLTNFRSGALPSS